MEHVKLNNITVYNTDYMQLLVATKNKSYDVALLDPQYGINVGKMAYLQEKNTKVVQKNGTKLNPNKNKKAYQQKEWDNEIPSFIFWKEIFRVSKNHMVFGANYFPELVGKPFLPPKRTNFKQFLKQHPIGWIIWDKCNGTNDYNDCELIKTSFNFDSYIINYMWAGMMQGSRNNGSVQEGNKKLNEKRIHPTQKPTRIYELLLTKHLKMGGVLIDTGFGSGSLGEAVQNLNNIFNVNYQLTACEKEVDYFNDSINRLTKTPTQLAIKL